MDDMLSNPQKLVPFYLNGEVFSVQDFLDGVDTVLSKVREENDWELVANQVTSMTSFGKATGISLAKLVNEGRKLWKELGMSGDFFSYISNFSEVSDVVLQRYDLAWEAVLNAPTDTVRERLLTQPMKNLNALGSKLSQGLELDDDDWVELSITRRNADFLNKLNGSSEDKPRKNRTTIYIEEDGSITVWGDGKTVLIGYINMDMLDDPLAEKAFNRIVQNSGIILRKS